MIDFNKYLRVFLLIVALHSFFVAAGLILLPAGLFHDFGYSSITEPFFKAQGGVFHFVMVIIYLLAAVNPVERKYLVQVSFIAKFTATIFLLSYFIFVDSIIVVFLSGLGDFLMGIIIYILYKKVN